MLSLDDCRKIIRAHVEEKNRSTEIKIALTQQVDKGEFCFAFHWQSEAFVKRSKIFQSIAGVGPTLVDRRDGKIITMDHTGSMENYEKRGDPHNAISSIVTVAGNHGAGLRRESFRSFRDATGKSISECRDILDGILRGEIFLFDTETWRDTDSRHQIDRFRELGFDVERLTTFEVRDLMAPKGSGAGS